MRGGKASAEAGAWLSGYCRESTGAAEDITGAAKSAGAAEDINGAAENNTAVGESMYCCRC